MEKPKIMNFNRGNRLVKKDFKYKGTGGSPSKCRVPFKCHFHFMRFKLKWGYAYILSI